MKILHISNFVQKQNGRLQWNHCFKINNGFIRNGHNVCTFSDRDMSRMNLINKLNNNKNLNKSLIETFKNFYPDLVVLGHADKIHNETLNEFRSINKNIKIIEWNVDNYYLDNTEDKFKKRSYVIDAFFITNADENLKSCLTQNNSISFFPNIFDKSIEHMKIFELAGYTYDVFYALSYGVGTGKIRKNKSDYDREVYLEFISNNYPEIRNNFFGYNGIQPVWGSVFENELSKSPISLNLSRKPNLKYYSSDRISQYLGNGSCIFVDKNSQLDDLFTNDEVVFFDSEDLTDFGKKISYYIANINETKRIAKNGWNKGHKAYNEKIVTKYFLEIVFKNKPESDYVWPIHHYFK
ncbi:glycosyltransferase [Pelagibacteraceae bacterium]|nr:glycosyltransferase [Pelagibacteraceae bacterium]